MGALDFGLDEFAQISVYYRAQYKPLMPRCLLKSRDHCNLCAKKLILQLAWVLPVDFSEQFLAAFLCL